MVLFFFIDSMHGQSVFNTQLTFDGFLNSFDNKKIPSFVNLGVQGLVPISSYDKSIDQTEGAAFVMMLGYNTVVLEQVSNHHSLNPIPAGEIFWSNAGDTSGFQSPRGSLVFQGGALETAGSLITGSFAYNTVENDAWVVAAGSDGLFVLQKEDGSGASLFKDQFSNITDDLIWKLKNELKFIKKIICDDGILYIMTLDCIYKAEMAKANIAGKTLKLKKIFALNSITQKSYASFSDMIVSGHTMIIASSEGVFRNRIGSSPRFDITSFEKLELPDLNYPAVKLYAITETGIETDFAKKNYGPCDLFPVSNVYVLSSSIGIHQGLINRLAIYSNNKVNPSLDETVFVIPNIIINNSKTYFTDTQGEKLNIATDGANLFTYSLLSNGLMFRGIIDIMNDKIRSYEKKPHSFVGTSFLAPRIKETFNGMHFLSDMGVWAMPGSFGILTYR